MEINTERASDCVSVCEVHTFYLHDKGRAFLWFENKQTRVQLQAEALLLAPFGAALEDWYTRLVEWKLQQDGKLPRLPASIIANIFCMSRSDGIIGTEFGFSPQVSEIWKHRPIEGECCGENARYRKSITTHEGARGGDEKQESTNWKSTGGKAKHENFHLNWIDRETACEIVPLPWKSLWTLFVGDFRSLRAM